MCDVEVVAHRQAPHSASDAGGDSLPPQLSHPPGRAPVKSKRLFLHEPSLDIGSRRAEEPFVAKQKSATGISWNTASTKLSLSSNRLQGKRCG